MLLLKQVTLPSTDITTTALGFGCNDLLGDKTRDQGLALLHAAFDAGIRHFDVARYYNYGDAEAMVGQMARGKRDQITITTKFGLQPAQNVARFKSVVGLVRRMMRSSSLIRKLVRRRVQAVVQKGRFGVESARRSLETSLRELGTDYIDIYLMHEAELADCQPELLAFLREARQQGKIRCFGIGTGFERAEPLCQTMPEFTAVTQFESTIISPNVHKIERESEKLEGGARAIITHGAFEAVSKLRTRMQSDSDFARSAREIVGADCADPRVLSGLILQHAMQANPNGIVLFRSADPRRVATNITAASEPQFTAGQLTQFEALCSQLRASQ